jgi:hypothetical protein
MTTISTVMPDSLLLQAKQAADREKITLDQFIARAVASQLSQREARKRFAERAEKGDWEEARKILAKAPDLEPEPADRL